MSSAYGDTFLTAIIDHEPNYSVTMVFTRDVPADEVRSKIPADLRSVLKVKRSRYSAAEIRDRQKAIAAALLAQGLVGSISYDYRNDKFDVGVGAEGGPGELMGKLPADLRSDVVPHREYPSNFQTGVQTGDAIYGDWIYYDANKRAVCTWGFPVRTTTDNRQSILTAAHCPTGTSYTFYSTPAPSGHYVTMPAPSVDRRLNSGNRSYDFRVIPTTTLGSGPYVWYFNPIRSS